MDISDAGATGHFLLPGTPVTDISPATKCLVINLTNGETIQSTHTLKLAIPWIPNESKISHKVLGLSHS